MNISIAPTSHLTHEAFLDQILYRVLAGNHQLAFWRSPKSNLVQIVLDDSDRVKRVTCNLESLPKGFIAHPFADQNDKKAYFLEASQYYTFDLDQPAVSEPCTEGFATVKLDKEELKTQIHSRLHSATSCSKAIAAAPSTLKEDFLKIVQQGIAEISQGNLMKVVPARRQRVSLRKGFDLVSTFLQLCKSYPNAFVNFFHIPKIGTWLGATPEVLIKTEGDLFHTMALAGTQKAEGDNPVKTAAWTQKEIEEQALVSRYIVNNFKKIRLREYEELGPKTVMAGDLLHLRSDFRVNMNSTGFPQLGSVMLDLLHPTSAVCGTPREAALDFIQHHENFDRGFFSGFIGPVNIDQRTSIYVNLRTAQLIGDQAFLYAGAGVTEDSLPEKEWEETSLKCNIIGKFIQ